MRFLNRTRHTQQKRPANTLAIFVLTAPVLVGMVGLVVDTGLLLASQRQAQNIADACALAAAMGLFRGGNSTSATSAAQSFLTDNGYSTITLNSTTGNNINIPPTSGNYTSSGNFASTSGNYAEAILTLPVTVLFIPAVG